MKSACVTIYKAAGNFWAFCASEIVALDILVKSHNKTIQKIPIIALLLKKFKDAINKLAMSWKKQNKTKKKQKKPKHTKTKQINVTLQQYKVWFQRKLGYFFFFFSTILKIGTHF